LQKPLLDEEIGKLSQLVERALKKKPKGVGASQKSLAVAVGVR
jgi:hypothetical protein